MFVNCDKEPLDDGILLSLQNTSVHQALIVQVTDTDTYKVRPNTTISFGRVARKNLNILTVYSCYDWPYGQHEPEGHCREDLSPGSGLVPDDIVRDFSFDTSQSSLPKHSALILAVEIEGKTVSTSQDDLPTNSVMLRDDDFFIDDINFSIQ